MSNGDVSQEQYLNSTPIGGIALRGCKKLITELTSIKTLTLGAVVTMLFLQKIEPMWGVVCLLALTGAKEIDFNQFTEILKLRIGGGK